jgi:hypothetical protein
MMKAFPRALLLAGVLSGSISIQGAAPPELRVEFEARAVTIRGISIGGDVVVYSLARDQVQFNYAHTSIWRFVATETGGGAVRLVTSGEIDARRLWVVVDQASGRSLITRTSSLEPVERLAPALLRQEKDGRGDRVSLPFEVAEVLLIRPGEGAWMTPVGDGGGDDDDGKPDGRVSLRPGKLHDFYRKEKKNDKLNRDDVLIAIDPRTLRVMEARLK